MLARYTFWPSLGSHYTSSWRLLEKWPRIRTGQQMYKQRQVEHQLSLEQGEPCKSVEYLQTLECPYFEHPLKSHLPGLFVGFLVSCRIRAVGVRACVISHMCIIQGWHFSASSEAFQYMELTMAQHFADVFIFFASPWISCTKFASFPLGSLTQHLSDSCWDK